MANDYFPMAGPSEPAGGDQGPEAGAGRGEERPGEDQGNTALLPKSILAGKDFKPGEEVVLKIVRIHDDEVEVAYASEKPGGEGPSADQEIDQMAGGGNPGGMEGGGY